MRVLRTTAAVITAIGATFAFATPATAASVPNGSDTASWNPSTDILSVCDGSSGNGTAMAVLQVIGGSQWTLFDSNGAQPGCSSAGPLSVNDSKSGILSICTNSSATNCRSTAVDL